MKTNTNVWNVLKDQILGKIIYLLSNFHEFFYISICFDRYDMINFG